MIEAQDVSSALDRYLKNLQSDRGALVAANESAEVLEENEALIADTQAARNLIVIGALARRDLATKARRHEEILPKCVEARELVDRLKPRVEPANQRYLTANKNWEYAEQRLASHCANPLSANEYPSTERTRKWNGEKLRLAKAAEEHRLEMLALKAEAAKLTSDLMKAIEEFNRLSFEERQLRPPAAPPKIIATAWRAPEQAEVTPLGPNR